MYYYKQVQDGQIVSVESKTVNIASPGFIPASKAKYNSFLASLPPPGPEPPDQDTLRAWEIAANSPDVMTQVEIWEVLRLLIYRVFGNPPA